MLGDQYDFLGSFAERVTLGLTQIANCFESGHSCAAQYLPH